MAALGIGLMEGITTKKCIFFSNIIISFYIFFMVILYVVCMVPSPPFRGCHWLKCIYNNSNNYIQIYLDTQKKLLSRDFVNKEIK